MAGHSPQYVRAIALDAKQEAIKNGVSSVLRPGYSDTVVNIRLKDVSGNLWLNLALLACGFAMMWMFGRVVRRCVRKGRFATYDARSQHGWVD